MQNILKKIDKILCYYIGLSTQAIIPVSVKVQGKKLLITNTESFKRHLHTNTWENFFSKNIINTLDEQKKRSVGIAIGKAIAKNLVVSFDEMPLKRLCK